MGLLKLDIQSLVTLSCSPDSTKEVEKPVTLNEGSSFQSVIKWGEAAFVNFALDRASYK